MRLLYEVIDNEASESETSKVQEHTRKCTKCSARYELEMKFKNCIEEKGKFSPECEELKQKITQQLDAIDEGRTDQELFPPPLG
jgi:anti-sigma factor (TIGR02949 family)